MKRILVTGSRDWVDMEAIKLAMQSLGVEKATLVTGACPTGADQMAKALAKDWGWLIEEYPADWAQYGKRAGYLRNRHMVELGADICLAFIKGGSAGSSMTAHLAEEAGIPTRRVIR